MRVVARRPPIALHPESLAAFQTARRALERVMCALDAGLLGYAPVDACAEERPEMAHVVSALHRVVRAAIRTTIDAVAPNGGVTTAESTAAAVAELEHAVRWSKVPAAEAQLTFSLKDYSRVALVGLVREAGLESFGARCRLVRPRRTVLSLEFEPLSPIALQAALLRWLMHRAERFQFACDSPLVLDEMEAADWQFMSWSAPLPLGSIESFRGWDLRGTEWTVAERRSIVLGDTVTGMLASRPQWAQLRPRQCAMARSLTHSFSGVFVCEAVDEGTARFRGLHDGRVVAVSEHRVPPPFGPGWLALGRLIPLGDGQHLRSAGMRFLPPPKVHHAREVDRAVDLVASSPVATLATEGAIAILRYGADVPRDVVAGWEPVQARRQLAEFNKRWREFQTSNAGGHPPRLDDTLTGWLASLETTGMSIGVQQPPFGSGRFHA